MPTIASCAWTTAERTGARTVCETPGAGGRCRRGEAQR
jgi:hypothetical protein